MLAAVLEGVRQQILKQVPLPQPGPTDVVMQVKACGICQTDYKAYTGDRMNWEPPMICGHEASGIVAAIGAGVAEFAEGDEVVMSPAVSCGLCEPCRLGRTHYCADGAVIGGDGFDTVLPGAFAEYVRVPVRAVFRKPKNVSFAAAALTEPLGGCWKGLIKYVNLRLGEDFVVVGAGGMGMLLILLAKAAGAGKILALDVADLPLQRARECGATHLLNLRECDGKEAVYDILPKGPDVVFEAAGPLEAAQLAYDLCRRGTKLNVFGVTTPGDIHLRPGEYHFLEIETTASFSVSTEAMQRSLELQEKGLIDTEKIITHRFPLEQLDEAYAMMARPDRVKVMIEVA
ncbi:MAG: hypothetical protein AUJ96_07595 [Armatimonadetes bacterium CG2_30_66_41]|nr:alcohol dehydrogenase catalytic domain-containing protein [Armatimonadota bacterium]NCQ31418.1 alcohol dehydrogenase catalytic domain-containing protein [Armatimonadota bacterium]OIP07349.1 MAG: hypothetical protein AUJ96_07595 [Armatimonadetes bacterium CG2_30_66_41]PIU95655.1 MAG: hypothetical protein COS65_01355 [Armatimonadetes bacterium CG06_land_8_20_14_3_00_66_21]PIX43398.1 MAG: hypothetical protein COZ57_19290 [Armatimonadetes bacterium CG_4_8_14_3_um_filter_66_20]